MGIDCVRRQEKLFRDFYVGISFRNQRNDLEFTLSDGHSFTIEFG